MINIFVWFSKNIEAKDIKNINEATKLIKKLILLKKRDECFLWVNELKEKEIKSYNNYIKNNKDNEKIKNKNLRKFNYVIKKLDNLNNDIKKEKEKNDSIIRENNERNLIKKLKIEINNLIKDKKINEANQILLKLFNDFSTKPNIVRFYNSERKKILNLLEKEKNKKIKSIRQNTYKEAQQLIWEIIVENRNKNDIKKSFFIKILNPINSYKNFKQKIKRKKLIDEVTYMIKENDQSKNDILNLKMANIHKWLIKEVKSSKKMPWYEIYWRILWNEKVSWDVIWLTENKKNSNFFFWDATWHWIKAGFMVSLLTQKYNELCKKVSLDKLAFEINNRLKQDLQSWNFITWVIFEVENNNLNKLKYVWMWHEPMFLYRNEEKETIKVIPWWLAAWIRKFKDITKVIVKELEFWNNDIILTYSDWINEAKNSDWEMYWFPRLQKNFNDICKITTDLKKIYQYLIDTLIDFTNSHSFYDDVSIMLIKRESNRDIIDDKEKIVEILTKEWLEKNKINRIKWKTKEEINKEVNRMKKEKDLKNILKVLDWHYMTWEIPKLKQECIQHIKNWFIDKKINKYLKIALEKENWYKINQKNKKIINKLNMLEELYKRGEYEGVINECSNIISKDWNI